MFSIIGIFVVLGAVIGGYFMEGGNLHVLFQPAEVVIIFGAALGAFFISSPTNVIKNVARNITKIFLGKEPKKTDFLELLGLLYGIFSKIRKEGLVSIEAEIENPTKSSLFNKYKSIINDKELIEYICDNLKVMISTSMPAHELDELMEIDLESNHHEELIPSNSITKIADALPGLGIVAAVLGVVLTMGKIDQPPSVLGHSIGAALVGTFLGVLMCYGFVGPMGTKLEHLASQRQVFFRVVKTSLVSFVAGTAPQIAVEAGRRAVPGHERPSFTELENFVRKK